MSISIYFEEYSPLNRKKRHLTDVVLLSGIECIYQSIPSNFRSFNFLGIKRVKFEFFLLNDTFMPPAVGNDNLKLTFRLFILRNSYSASIAEKNKGSLDMVSTKFGDRNFHIPGRR